jgi:hypothetical protein
MEFDLLLRGGRVIDPSSSIDAVLDIGFSNGRVAALDREIPPRPRCKDRRRERSDRDSGPHRLAHPRLLGRHH